MKMRKSSLTDLVLAAAPTLIFVVLSSVSTLQTALIWTLLLSFGTLLWQWFHHESLLHAGIGCLIAVLGAVATMITGEARGYFLLSAFLPAAMTVICLVSILMRRPFAGLILNRLAGGPKEWYRFARLRRLYLYATLVCAGVNVVTTILQNIFYSNNQTTLLAVVHVGTGPLFAAIMAVTIAAARRLNATEGETAPLFPKEGL
jgi:hypothetical protein